MLQKFTKILAVTCLVAVACEAPVDRDATDRSHEGLCVAPTEQGTVVLELRDALVAETVEAPAVFLDFEDEFVELRDDGRGRDLAAHDGVFTGEVASKDTHFDPYCLSAEPDESDAPDASTPAPDEGGEVQPSIQSESDPQALPRIAGCHDEKVAYTSCGEVWYCDCWGWDVWSC
jgi:hypothetical protein